MTEVEVETSLNVRRIAINITVNIFFFYFFLFKNKREPSTNSFLKVGSKTWILELLGSPSVKSLNSHFKETIRLFTLKKIKYRLKWESFLNCFLEGVEVPA